MTIENFRPELKEILIEKGYTELRDFQGKILDNIKSGKNLCIAGDEGSGKSLALIFSILQKIEVAGEGSPRVIVICSSDQKAIEFHSNLFALAKLLDLTVDLAHEKGNILQQRNDIFDGTEIIVGTPRRIYDLYIQNGFNVSQMKMFILDDVFEILKGNGRTQIQRLVESLPKCQHVLTAMNFKDQRIQDYLETIDQHFQIVKA